MVELTTEVSLATVQLYLEKSPEDRTEKHKKIAIEALKILETKQAQFNTNDQILYQRGLAELLP